MRHGAWSDEAAADDLDRHRQLIAGTWPILAGQAVLSHVSAAVLQGLPVWQLMLARVSVTRAAGGHGGRTRHLYVRLAPLADAEVVELDGYRVTALERTAFDLARMLDYERAAPSSMRRCTPTPTSRSSPAWPWPAATSVAWAWADEPFNSRTVGRRAWANR